jgi:hypothetical protein
MGSGPEEVSSTDHVPSVHVASHFCQEQPAYAHVLTSPVQGSPVAGMFSGQPSSRRRGRSGSTERQVYVPGSPGPGGSGVAPPQ